MQKPVEEKVTGKAKRIDSEQDIIVWLRKVAAARAADIRVRESRIRNSDKKFYCPEARGAKAFEVVGIPLKDPGLYVVELESSILGASLLGANRPMYVPTAALVTNLSAHFKWGRESSIVWVTRLDNAEPVPNADITIRDCQGTLRWQGRSDANGLARFGEGVIDPKKLPVCRNQRDYDSESYMDYEYTRALEGMASGLFIFARTDDDMTFVHTAWDDGIEPWRFSLPGASLARPDYRPYDFRPNAAACGRDRVDEAYYPQTHPAGICRRPASSEDRDDTTPGERPALRIPA